MQDLLKPVIVYSLIAIYALVLTALFVWKIPTDNRDITYVVVGGLTSIVTTIVNFFFGSSKSSEEKNDTINRLAGK